MGLDIISRRNARLLNTNQPADDDYDNDEMACGIYYGEFMQAVAGLDLPEVVAGAYGFINFSVEDTPWDEVERASIGYIGYTAFRDALANLAGVGSYAALREGDAFWEMCWMSDCDGIFSTEASKQISATFEASREAWTALADADHDSPQHRLTRIYDEWARVFKDAADHNGIVLYR